LVLIGFFLGVIFQDLRWDITALFGDNSRQVAFYSRSNNPSVANIETRVFGNTISGLFAAMLVSSAVYLSQAMTHTRLLVVGLLLVMGVLSLTWGGPLSAVIRDKNTNASGALDAGKKMVAYHAFLTLILLAAIVVIANDLIVCFSLN